MTRRTSGFPKSEDPALTFIVATRGDADGDGWTMQAVNRRMAYMRHIVQFSNEKRPDANTLTQQFTEKWNSGKSQLKYRLAWSTR